GLDGIPEVLIKFQRIVGVGRIKGPVILEGKRPLYYWEATSRPDLGRVAELLGSWLGPIKRAQFESALGCSLPPTTWPGTMSEELAWAGGFFDGEGSSYLLQHLTHPGQLIPAVDVPQSGWQGVPAELQRLHAALGGVGHISGPHKFKWADKLVSRWRTESVACVQLVLHRLMPFVGEIKRSQAQLVLKAIHSQPDLARGNPAFGVAGARHCLRGHDKSNARVRPFKGRGANEDDPRLHLRQCMTCVREDARQRRKKKRRP
ncbi:MAG: hypothetical protein M3T56_15970, partial [Chloroflexota bacterium]|nr:hypothetical protein [Chloroflexota bacterium]